MENSSLNESFDLQVVIISGVKDIEKAITGLAMALSAASGGGKVVVFLTMEGAAFANPEEGQLQYVDGFESVQQYLDLLLDEDAKIEVCTTCVENFCKSKKINNKKIIRPGAHYAGLSTAALRSLTVKTIVF